MVRPDDQETQINGKSERTQEAYTRAVRQLIGITKKIRHSLLRPQVTIETRRSRSLDKLGLMLRDHFSI